MCLSLSEIIDTEKPQYEFKIQCATTTTTQGGHYSHFIHINDEHENKLLSGCEVNRSGKMENGGKCTKTMIKADRRKEIGSSSDPDQVDGLTDTY